MKKRIILAVLILSVIISSGSFAQNIWTNPITGVNPNISNPYTTGDLKNANITVSGIGRSPGITGKNANDRYNADDWSILSTLNTDDYYYFTLTPAAGYRINFSSFVYTSQSSPTGPVSFAIRSSIDQYQTNIGAPTSSGTTIDLSGYQNISSEITFRFYAWGGNNIQGTFSVNDFTFNGTVILFVPLSAPVLSSPSNNSTGASLTPLLDWSDVSLANKYRLQVSTALDFSNLLINESALTNSQFTPASGILNNNTKYYWRVYAGDNNGWSSASAVWNFTTIPAPLSVPVLSSPLNNSTGTSLTPLLDWSDVSLANKYHLQVSTAIDFSNLLINENALTNSQFTPASGILNNNTKYYWRVYAGDNNGWSSASSVWNFTTLLPAILSAPVLSSPVDNSTGVVLNPILKWSEVLGAAGYKVKVSTDPTFASVLDSASVTANQYTVTAGKLIHNVKYYWKVAAYDLNGTGSYSAVWGFTTTSAPPPVPWTLYNTGVPYSLFGVDFSETDPNIGVAVGQGGTVIKTTDAGEEWMLTYSNINIWMNDVKFDPNTPGVVWAAGMGGVIIKSTDNGDTWTVVRPFDDPNNTIRGIGVPSGTTGFATFIGYAGTYFETYNGGATFVQRFDIPFTMHSIAYSPNYPTDGRGIISGTDGKVWNTTNSGTTWVSRNTNRYDYMNDVVFINPDEAIICGNNGTILRSTNFGKNWTLNTQNLTSEHLRSIDAFGNIVTLCGDNGKIMTSNDAGLTFVDQLNGDSRHFYAVSLRSSAVGVVVGEVGSAGSGALYYTSMNGIVGVTQTGTEIPKEYTMSQNYPNPFNPTTKIDFSVPLAAKVSLIVYDLSGREVTRLANNEFKSAGYYTVQFNAGNLSSGVYFYRLISGKFSQTKKLILIK